MNEQLQKIAEDAGVDARTMGFESNQHHRDPWNARLEKFAELIVRECANYINQRTLDWDAELRWIFNDGSGDMAVDVDDLLNRHFGVEE